MAKYLMKHKKEIIDCKDFNGLRAILKNKLDDDSYVRSLIKGVLP